MDGLKHELKLRIGSLAGVAMPSLSREIRDGRHTARGAFFKRLITYSEVHQAARAQDTERVQAALASFWRGEDGDRFHTRHREARFRRFLEHHAVICERMREFLDTRPGKFTRLVEVGCGDGQVLYYTAGRLPELSECIGIDINRSALGSISVSEDNDPRVSFEEGDALAWLREFPKDGSILLTYGGVLEYLSHDSVAALFSILGLNRPAAVALVEPLDPDHDIAVDPESRIFGRENSFSHAYPALLDDAGYTVTWQAELIADGFRWLLILAESDESAKKIWKPELR